MRRVLLSILLLFILTGSASAEDICLEVIPTGEVVTGHKIGWSDTPNGPYTEIDLGVELTWTDPGVVGERYYVAWAYAGSVPGAYSPEVKVTAAPGAPGLNRCRQVQLP